MSDTKYALPTVEGDTTSSDGDILHPNYLVDLLPEDAEQRNPVYRGDVYEESSSTLTELWEKETADLPYLNKIRRATKAFPGLAHLVSWMEVSTAVTRHKAISSWPSRRQRRADYVRVCQLDLNKGQAATETHFSDRVSLSNALSAENLAKNTSDARVYIVEDLSRSVIETLGEALNVDPHFFRAHLDDYLWSPVGSEAVELRSLDLCARKRSYVTLQYVRPRYYKTGTSYKIATRQAANFNVLRQLDSDRSRKSIQNSVGAAAALMRAKTSLWIQPQSIPKKGVIAILLIDPTPSEGFRLWGGYWSFENWPNDDNQTNLAVPPRTSLYKDVIYWMTRMNDQDIAAIAYEPRNCALVALRLILADWHTFIQYITAQLGQIEWEIEIPALRNQASGIDATIQKLHPWRRNVSLYRTWVAQSINRIFSKETQLKYRDKIPDPDCGLPALLPDFQIVLQDIDNIQARIERIVSVAAALMSIEEGRRAMVQNNYVARLTFLATIFIPLTFVSGLLSMVPNLSELKQTMWIYFTVAIPLTAVALVVADFGHLRQKTNELISRMRKKKKQA